MTSLTNLFVYYNLLQLGHVIVYYVNVLFVKQWWYFSILSINNSPGRSLYCLTKSVGPSQRVRVFILFGRSYWFICIR